MLLALLFLGLSMMLTGHLFKGVLCAFLQATIIGWFPAAVWAVSLKSMETSAQHHEAPVVLQASQVPA
ncbi:hypothetical protein [Hymenobacter sp.]|jgi:hypothetical protein|uniref:hypothetical protein n=1 Tax=Hymenobacter sp. TaxID=1898978 RepID=UPI002ED84E2E